MNNEIYEIPGYEYHKFLGKGGMGSVSLYWDKKVGKRINRLVAGKSLLKEIADSEKADMGIKYFEKEFDTLLMLEECVNIPRAHEFIENKKNRHIIMENVRGYNLAEITDYLYKKNEFMNPEFAADIVYEVAQALQAAHNIGIIHRDLTPFNVKIKRHENPVRIKVLDFGLAIERKYQEQGVPLNIEEGNKKYMSPEQILKNGVTEINERSDIHQLGQMFYQLTTNIAPFFNKKVERRRLTFEKLKDSLKKRDWDYIKSMIKKEFVDLPERILEGLYIPPKRINPKLPEYYSEIIERCLQTNPNNRYQNVTQIMNTLEKTLERSKIEKGLKIFLQTISTNFPPIKTNGPGRN